MKPQVIVTLRAGPVDVAQGLIAVDAVTAATTRVMLSAG